MSLTVNKAALERVMREAPGNEKVAAVFIKKTLGLSLSAAVDTPASVRLEKNELLWPCVKCKDQYSIISEAEEDEMPIFGMFMTAVCDCGAETSVHSAVVAAYNMAMGATNLTLEEALKTLEY